MEMATKPKLEQIGAGAWYAGHLLAAHAKTDEEQQAFLYLVQVYKDHFLCKKCQGHLAAFIEAHPPEKYASQPEGLFRWFYEAHDDVNRRKGKPRPSYETVRSWYFGSEAVCTLDCGESPSPRPSSGLKLPTESKSISSPKARLSPPLPSQPNLPSNVSIAPPPSKTPDTPIRTAFPLPTFGFRLMPSNQ